MILPSLGPSWGALGPAQAEVAAMDLEAAAAYAARHRLHALVVVQGDAVVHERYGEGYDTSRPHALYSGTKSFWGVTALAAEADGLLALDETVGATIPAWRSGPRAAVTLRHLLQLTAGIGFGGLGNAVPTFERALEVELVGQPGGTFTYGGIPLQVFGAVLTRKLATRGLTPQAYLRERLLDPIGLAVGDWRRLKDGTQPLPTGAFVAATEWWKFGRLVAAGGSWHGRQLLARERLAACLRGSSANPRYGLGWWLSPLDERPDVFYASGSGGQALYVLPQDDAVVVHFGASPSWRHETFLRRLLAPPRARRTGSTQ